MAQLAVERFLATQFVFDLSTVTTGLVASLEMLIGFVNAIRRAGFPLILLRQSILTFIISIFVVFGFGFGLGFGLNFGGGHGQSA